MSSGSEGVRPQIHWHHMFLLRLPVTLLTAWGVVVATHVGNPFAFV
jgi:hypothetical protein